VYHVWCKSRACGPVTYRFAKPHNASCRTEDSRQLKYERVSPAEPPGHCHSCPVIEHNRRTEPNGRTPSQWPKILVINSVAKAPRLDTTPPALDCIYCICGTRPGEKWELENKRCTWWLHHCVSLVRALLRACHIKNDTQFPGIPCSHSARSMKFVQPKTHLSTAH